MRPRKSVNSSYTEKQNSSCTENQSISEHLNASQPIIATQATQATQPILRGEATRVSAELKADEESHSCDYDHIYANEKYECDGLLSHMRSMRSKTLIRFRVLNFSTSALAEGKRTGQQPMVVQNALLKWLSDE